jgi:hypothetical protein
MNLIVYEVNLQIDSIAADEYAEWLGPHIEQILNIEGFHKAEWFVCDSEDDKVNWSIRYYLDSRELSEEVCTSFNPRRKRQIWKIFD